MKPASLPAASLHATPHDHIFSQTQVRQFSWRGIFPVSKHDLYTAQMPHASIDTAATKNSSPTST